MNGNGLEDIVSANNPDVINGEDEAGNHASSNGFPDQESSDLFLLPLKKVNNGFCTINIIYWNWTLLNFLRFIWSTSD